MTLFEPHTYTVESVTEGHPDKVCDQISDAILDACLEQDPNTRAGIETFGSHGTVVLGGEITTNADVDYEKIARDVYKSIGYDDPIKVVVCISEQAPDIAMGVNTGGAGDQGIMYGYATDETPEYLPVGVVLVNKLTRGLSELRKSGEVSWLGPDGKAQVTMEGDKVVKVLVSCQHSKDVSQDEVHKTIKEKLIEPIVGSLEDDKVLINPTGKFTEGGFLADAGLTGRKIMIDTYGGLIPHGGGAFSGKDATKVDRSAAYMCRYAAKNLVAQGHAKKCLVSVAYAIGVAEPLMVSAVNENGELIAADLLKDFDFRPKQMIEFLELRKPIYRKNCVYGHFGAPDAPWNKVG
ncbi:MAG: methionine adenosyltransferase [Parcubacteria group bacterium]